MSKTLSVQEISTRLKIQPSESHEKGSPFNKRFSGGRVRKESSWILDSNSDETSLESHIENLVSIIESKFTEFEKLFPDCHIDIYCGFLPKNVDDEGMFTLSSTLLKRLAAISMDISVVLYPPQGV
ncbi:MAG: DUF4279 domain-containing protein [Cyanothece sp. SIO1E1]|nr:DUF4279 domain-containing protein [Cyanothece sp. SIO1E1]